MHSRCLNPALFAASANHVCRFGQLPAVIIVTGGAGLVAIFQNRLLKIEDVFGFAAAKLRAQNG